MQRLKIILADPDSVYVDRVADYINTVYSARIKIVVCTRLSLLEHYLRTSFDEFDFLLIHPEFFTPDSELYKNVKFIIGLTDDGNPEFLAEGLECIYKYQPGDRLVDILIKMYSEKMEKLPGSAGGIRDTKVITVFSSAGGVGKTSVALGLAAALSENHREILLLSMETFNTVSACLEKPGSEGFTKVLLTLNENPALLPTRVEMHKTKDRNLKFSILEPPECFFEISELQTADIEILLVKLKQSCKYDALIIDTDSSAGNNLMTLLKTSDKIIMVSTTDEICKYKSKAFINQLRKLEIRENENLQNKTIFLTNKVHENGNADELESGFLDTVMVPFITDLWSAGSSCKLQFDLNRQLTESLQSLIERVGFRPTSGA